MTMNNFKPLTNLQWQAVFTEMKQRILPSRFKKITINYLTEAPFWDKEALASHTHITNWQSYVLYINDTLTQLRHGETCYAWFAYQIEDFLRFEHDRLCTSYSPQERMWTLWLSET